MAEVQLPPHEVGKADGCRNVQIPFSSQRHHFPEGRVEQFPFAGWPGTGCLRSHPSESVLVALSESAVILGIWLVEEELSGALAQFYRRSRAGKNVVVYSKRSSGPRAARYLTADLYYPQMSQKNQLGQKMFWPNNIEIRYLERQDVAMACENSKPEMVWYDATTTLLQTLVLALEGHIEDQCWWKIRTDLVFLCLLEMTTLVDRTPTADAPCNQSMRQNLERAIPHVREMALVMRKRDPQRAYGAGNAALESLRTTGPQVIGFANTLV